MQAHPTSVTEATRRGLSDEFPGWSIIRTTDTARWWAIREPKPGRRLGVVTEPAADTPEELAELLRGVRAVEGGR